MKSRFGNATMHTFGRSRTPFFFLLPLLLILLVINIYPTVFEIGTSFSSRTMGMTSVHFVGLSNFRHMLTDPRFWNSLWVTLRLLLFALPAELIVGTAVALLLHNSPHRKLFLPALLLPIVATPIVVGFIFKYMYQEDYGLISYFLKLVHLFPGFNLTSQIHTVLLSLAFVDFWEWTPFVMLIMLAGFNGIPISVTEAANLDGASGWKRLWFIELPMLRAEFLVALLFRTVDIIRVYDIIYATTRGGPGAFSESASVYLQTTAFKFRDLGYASAFGFTLVLLGVALATLYLRVARPRGQAPA